jgi:hypothetical protein
VLPAGGSLQHAPHHINARQHLLPAAVVQRSLELRIPAKLPICIADRICCIHELLPAALVGFELLADSYHGGIKQRWVELLWLICCAAARPAEAFASLGSSSSLQLLQRLWLPVVTSGSSKQAECQLCYCSRIPTCRIGSNLAQRMVANAFLLLPLLPRPSSAKST